MFKKTILIFTLLLTSNTFAANSNTTTLTSKRIQIISTGTQRAYIYDLPINGGCTNKIPVLLFSGPNKNPLAKEIYSTLLTAKASGKKVTIQSNKCWPEYSTPIITSLYLY